MTNLLHRFLLPLSMLVIALLSFTSVAEACGTWSLMTSPNPSSNGNHLQAVAALSPSNAYAVGYTITSTNKNNLVTQPLILHFNGSSWSVMTSPSSPGSSLTGIAAVSATNIYAVGGSLILHFNGSRWSIVSHPPLCGLTAITAITATDIWAVGSAPDVQSKTCTVHFNGSTWSQVASPSPGTSDDALLAVAAVSSTNVYAVGTYCVGSVCDRGNGNFHTLIERFNGSSWSVVTSPNPSTYLNSLNGVAVVSASNIYAVGNYAPPNSQPGASSTLVERFNGSSWSVMPSPNVKGNSSLNAITVASSTNIYAVGAASIPTAPAHPTLIEQFNGSTWSIVTSPSPGMVNALNGVAPVPGTSRLFAVGSDSSNGPDQTLIESTC